MTEDSFRDPGHLARKVRGLYERFAALIRMDRTSILASYQQSLEEFQDLDLRDTETRDHVMSSGAEIIASLAESMQADDVWTGERYRLPAQAARGSRTRNQLSPADSHRQAAALFDITITSLAGHVEDDPELLPCFVTAVLALNEWLSTKVSAASAAHTQYLLDCVHEAQVDERRRIARELHDRLGEGLSVALRQLELYELISGPGHPHELTPQLTAVKEALVEGMRRLRLLTSDLRQEPVTSLEKALALYLDSLTADAIVSLRFRGDESWASSTVIDETYLIIREAIRNALAHGAPRSVLVAVSIKPDKLRARVKDDGTGFVPAPPSDDTTSSSAAGLASMRERASILGGALSVSSAPGKGTTVKLCVPLSGPAQ